MISRRCSAVTPLLLWPFFGAVYFFDTYVAAAAVGAVPTVTVPIRATDTATDTRIEMMRLLTAFPLA